MTGLSLPTVRSIVKDIYQVMEADLRIEDVQVGRVGSDGQPIVVEIDESKFVVVVKPQNPVVARLISELWLEHFS
ncbi:hypothetical protein G6F55_014394 [Rhizopus delemar]|nr:hypothetical protein G6F55_014394 [Rhizopus delemar]